MREFGREVVEEGEGVKKYKLSPNSHGDVEHNLGNRANDIVIFIYGVRRGDLLG